MIKWQVRVHPLAVPEIQAMKDNHPEWLEEFNEILYYLCRENDPRNPQYRDKHRHINCEPMRWYAEGWWRVYAFRLPLRLVFRILEGDGNHIIEIGAGDVLDEKEPHTLQVMRAAERSVAYNGEFKRRVKTVRKSEAA
jgi:hypothetical protein